MFQMVKCIKDRRRQRRQRLPTSVLNKMLIHKFQKGDPYDTCAICLDDYIEGENLRVLPCAHGKIIFLIKICVIVCRVKCMQFPFFFFHKAIF